MWEESLMNLSVEEEDPDRMADRNSQLLGLPLETFSSVIPTHTEYTAALLD